MGSTKFIMDLREFNFNTLNKYIVDHSKTLYISTFNFDIDLKLTDFISRFNKVVLVLNPVPFAEQLKRIESVQERYSSNNLFKLLKIDNIEVSFNRYLHAKIVGTEEALYVGSSNFSYHSKDNIEAGFLSTSRVQNENIISALNTNVIENSLSLRCLINTSMYHQGTNTIQQSIDIVLPMYEDLLNIIKLYKSIINQTHPERPQLCLEHISLVQEQLTKISKLLSQTFNNDTLKVEEFLISAKWSTNLQSSKNKIEKYVKASTRLQQQAVDANLYDKLTLEDYPRFFGEGSIDDFVTHSNAFEKALQYSKEISQDLLTETKKLQSYLYSLSTIAKHYRIYTKK